MLFTCTHMATVGVKGLSYMAHVYAIAMPDLAVVPQQQAILTHTYCSKLHCDSQKFDTC